MEPGILRLWLVVAAPCVFLAGCAAVGPNFTSPQPDVPATYPAPQPTSAPPTASSPPNARIELQSDPDPRWWHSLSDPTLDWLIERGVAGNLDLQAAVLRIVSARAQEQAAAAQGLPSLKANASYTREQLGARGFIDDQGSSLGNLTKSPDGNSLVTAIEQPLSVFQAGFDASWELDLFGRVRRATEAAQAQAQAVIESRNDALVSLEAEIVQTYIQLRAAQTLEDLTRAQITVGRQILDLSESRNRYGLASQTDVESARAQVSTIEAALPQYELQITEAQNALAVLTGQTPGSLDAILGPHGALPVGPLVVPVGLPASLARRRPDVREAEANLHAATAQTGVAVAQLFPDISLTAQAGRRAGEARYLADWANTFWSFAPSISLPIFEGGALEANVKSARAEQDAAALSYRKAVLVALQDVENAIESYARDQDRRNAVERVVSANQHTLDLAESGYRNGLVSFITVLNAEQQLDQQQQQLAQSSEQTSVDLVALYKALGGGWQNAPNEPTPPLGTLGNSGMPNAAR